MGVVMEAVAGFTQLTVMKTSLFFAGDGFSVYDSNAHLVFRVDSYGGPNTRDHTEIVLMDPHGRCLLTLRRKTLSLHQRWEGYLGEINGRSKPAFSVRKSSVIGRPGVTVQMYDSMGEEYQIEGSFAHRNCTVYDAANRVAVAEIKRKVDSKANVLLGKDVFVLSVKMGFDCVFAMGLVLVLDQISSGDNLNLSNTAVQPLWEKPMVKGTVNVVAERVA